MELMRFVLGCATAVAMAGPSVAQQVDTLAGVRATGPDSIVGYTSATVTFGEEGGGGVVVRGDGEMARTSFAGTLSEQQVARILVGYSLVLDDATVTFLGGATHVNRSVDGTPTINATGLYGAVEGFGFIGETGYWAGLAQYSQPDDAFYTRAYGLKWLGGNFNVGPDATYLHETDYQRFTAGVRTTWTFDNAALSLIGGLSSQSGSAGPRENDGFVEAQLGFSF